VIGQTGVRQGAGHFDFRACGDARFNSFGRDVGCRRVSLVVLSLLDVHLLVVDVSLGEVAYLSLRGAMVHGLPFMAFVLLQRDMSGFPVVVQVLVEMVG
jgi:hypothetical protein